MNGALQNQIKPHTSTNNVNFSDASVKTVEKAVDSTSGDKTSFKDLIMNSNNEAWQARQAQKNGDDLAGAKTDAEFAKMLSEKFNKENMRKPQNELDKESFLKLFVTQLQNQDPLNPDDSAEMAAQLAQFHGLEQMMNVNKNLEKMQDAEGTSRAVSLINFVGKDIKLDSGKVRLENGEISQALYRLDGESVSTTLEVRDASGVVVHTSDMGTKPAGEHLIEWNGLDKDGKKAPAGAYTLNVLAKDINGNDLPTKMTTTVRVTGVDLKDSGGSFYTDMGKVRIAEIASVGELGALASKAAGGAKKDTDPKAAKPAAAADAGGNSTSEQSAQQAPGSVEPVTPAANAAPAAPEQPAPVQATAPDMANGKPVAPAEESPLENRNMISQPGMPPMMEIPVPAGVGGK
jgi:flagellar basal-body rod modification protein FlgD